MIQRRLFPNANAKRQIWRSISQTWAGGRELSAQTNRLSGGKTSQSHSLQVPIEPLLAPDQTAWGLVPKASARTPSGCQKPDRRRGAVVQRVLDKMRTQVVDIIPGVCGRSFKRSSPRATKLSNSHSFRYSWRSIAPLRQGAHLQIARAYRIINPLDRLENMPEKAYERN
jgi:hypothetical protein